MFFKAISNKTRCAIIKLLMKRPGSVTEICQKSGFEQSRVSHNLKCLELCGFVNARYKGKNRLYSLHPEMSSILKAIDKHLVKYRRLSA
ncbi:winged helix-turn-helix transcriptional regulator [Candidatus Woesearchaeota archaeon]|nr:winged helix-turn-helix transcriptional regulator [Candidatus Woesearchaeota archaeon]